MYVCNKQQEKTKREIRTMGQEIQVIGRQIESRIQNGKKSEIYKYKDMTMTMFAYNLTQKQNN